MSMHGAPLPPRSCLDRGTRSPTNDTEVNAMIILKAIQTGICNIRQVR